MKKIFIILIIAIFFTISCKNKNNVSAQDIPSTIDTCDSFETIKKVYYSLPSPVEMAMVVKKYSDNFSIDSLQSTDLAAEYTTIKSQALNLGIYTSDLAFLSMYEQTQYFPEYFSTIVSLANQLDILEGINDTLATDIENNIDNPDKIKEILAEAIFKSDAFLKENNKEYIASLILTGSWIESIYILSKLSYNQPETSNISQLLIDQRLILENVLKVTAPIVDTNITTMLTELQTLLNSCVIITKTDVVDPYTDSVRSKTLVEYNFNQDKISKIDKKISKIRNFFVSLH